MPRIVLLSDTHNAHEEINVPDGDILIHAGDATNSGTFQEITAFANWFKQLPHKHKIFVAGNHDWLFEKNAEVARHALGTKIIYLQDSEIIIEGLKIYGSPWQPRFFDWAFNLMRGKELAEKWRLIPNDVEVLITHGPPLGILDLNLDDFPCGCEDLAKRIEELVCFAKLKLHVFGHIHHNYGKLEKHGAVFVNASNCDEDYQPTNAPIIIDL
ncbi:MAG: metallophosphatase domain-containing protein [Pyrinomonadaceae bacterium]|nr:metallophosphatase domain-containing protein [Pyrinomonadaceae bacterium]